MYATLLGICPPRRHEQRVSSKKIYALYCNANLRLASTDTGVYYVLDAGSLRPLRRHEQWVSSKNIYALYCNANLRLGSTDLYFCVCWADGMTCPASAVRDGPFPCFPLYCLCFAQASIH